MDLFESVNKLLQDKHTLTEAKTVLRVTFDNGMKKDIEFKGSFEAGKKAYLGKNVKAISKDKTPVMLKAVKVEPINESNRGVVSFSKDPEKMSKKEQNRIKEIEYRFSEIDAETHIINLLDMSENLDSKEVKKIYAPLDKEKTNLANERAKIYKDNDIEVKYHPTANSPATKTKFTNAFIKHLKDMYGKYEDKYVTSYINKIEQQSSSKINESKDLEPMKTFKVTYHDGSSYKTSARAKSEEDFKKYLTQDGPWVVTDEDEETGKETKKKIVKVEDITDEK